MVFSPTLLYQSYNALRKSKSSKESSEPFFRSLVKPAPKVSHNATVRAKLRAMSSEEHAAVLDRLKGRQHRRMAKEIEKITHERYLKALRSGIL